MRHGMHRCWAAGMAALVVVIATIGTALAPSAKASITPSATTSTPTPLTAGATGSLDLDLKFAPSSGDSPDALTINLPPGFLADAAVDGGACLTGHPQISSSSPCQIGSGEIAATVDGLVPITTGVDFYLVPPPSAGDLAGLAVGPGDGSQIGTTGPITIRPSGSPDGVGVTIALTLPDSLSGQSVSISEVDSTFTALRFPATCPTTPSAISVTADSYQDATAKTASLPIAVGGCGSLPYAPTFSASASRHGATASISTTFTQTASQSPNASVALALPLEQLKPALAALHLLCENPSSGSCTPVASVTAVSPDYPKPLVGTGYLTGSLQGLDLELVFPPPFPLTLVGSVDLTTNVTTFTGLPDFPLTSLTVALPGGPHGLFDYNCSHPTGTASATTVDQNGDKSKTAAQRLTISGCSNTASGRSRPRDGRASARASSLTGLATGRPSLRLTVDAGRRDRLSALVIELPAGLSAVATHAHGRATLAGLSVRGARIRSVTVSHGRLRITLRSPVRTATITVGSRALRETAALRRAVSKRRVTRVRLAVLVRRPQAGEATVHVTFTHLES